MFTQDPDRQPRRDRLPRHRAPRGAWASRTVAVYSDADARRAARARWPTRPCASARRRRARATCVGDAILDGRARDRRGGDPSRLRLPVRERRRSPRPAPRPGIVFIGPPAAAIRAMGSKDAAKALMEQAGVPLVPGYHGDDQDPAFLRDARPTRIGYPGADQGRRRRRRQGHAPRRRARRTSPRRSTSRQREAQPAFGDDRVLIEKYVDAPAPHRDPGVRRHATATCVHLFERDCSVQRRHQKVIEEAPAPGMTAERRARDGRGRGRRPRRRSATSAPARSSSSPTAASGRRSTSWR